MIYLSKKFNLNYQTDISVQNFKPKFLKCVTNLNVQNFKPKFLKCVTNLNL